MYISLWISQYGKIMLDKLCFFICYYKVIHTVIHTNLQIKKPRRGSRGLYLLLIED